MTVLDSSVTFGYPLLALAAWRRGEYDRAVALSEQSLAAYRPVGDKRKIAVVLNNLGLVVRRQGDFQRARMLYEESLAIKRELGDEAAVAISLHNLGNIAWDEEADYGRASTLEQESLEIARRLGDKRSVAMALISLGDIATKQSKYLDACACYKESLIIASELVDKPRIAECLEGLAIVAGAQGEAARAGQLLAAAEALRQAIGAPRSRAQQADFEQALSEASSALGETPLALISAKSAGLTIEQTVSYALEILP